MTTSITLEFDIPDQVCKDVLCTACEGGSNYWLAAKKVLRDKDGEYLGIVGPCDAEDRKTTWPDVNFDTIRTGFVNLLRPGFNVNSTNRAAALEMLVNYEEATSWDAETADCILQAGMFNDMVYG